jgi:hypothetical protein
VDGAGGVEGQARGQARRARGEPPQEAPRQRSPYAGVSDETRTLKLQGVKFRPVGISLLSCHLPEAQNITQSLAEDE